METKIVYCQRRDPPRQLRTHQLRLLGYAFRDCSAPRPGMLPRRLLPGQQHQLLRSLLPPRVALPAPQVARVRTLAWITRHRRTVRDCERLPAHQSYIYWAVITVMTAALPARPGSPSGHLDRRPSRGAEFRRVRAGPLTRFPFPGARSCPPCHAA